MIFYWIHLNNKILDDGLIIYPLSYLILIFTYLKLCLTTATHNFKWVKITHMCLIWDQTFANLDV